MEEGFKESLSHARWGYPRPDPPAPVKGERPGPPTTAGFAGTGIAARLRTQPRRSASAVRPLETPSARLASVLTRSKYTHASRSAIDSQRRPTSKQSPPWRNSHG